MLPDSSSMLASSGDKPSANVVAGESPACSPPVQRSSASAVVTSSSSPATIARCDNANIPSSPRMGGGSPRVVAGTCPTINVNQMSSSVTPAKSTSNSCNNSTSAKSSSPLVKHSVKGAAASGTRSAGLQRSMQMKRGGGDVGSTFDTQSIQGGGGRNGHVPTATPLNHQQATTIPVRCGSCSNLSILNLANIPETTPVYGDHKSVNAAAGIYGCVGPTPALPPQESIYGSARRHSSFLMAPEYGNFYEMNGGGAWYPPPPPQAHQPVVNPQAAYYCMAPTMDYGQFKRAMSGGRKSLNEENRMKLHKKVAEKYADDTDGLSCVEICCGDAAKVLWAIVAIICFGFLITLLSALYLL